MADGTSPDINQEIKNKDQILSSKNSDKSIKTRLKNVAGKVMLRVPPLVAVLTSGTIDTPHFPAPEPPPTIAQAPDFKRTETLQPYSAQLPTETPKSSEQYRKPEALVIDVTKNTFANLKQYGFPTMPEAELAKSLNIEDLTMKNLTRQVPENEELQLAVLAQIMKLYSGHGEEVVRAMLETDKLLGVQSPAPQLSGLSAEMVKSFEIERDEIGNPTFWYELDNVALEKIIAKSPQKFINLSIELGKIGINFKIFETVQANPDAFNPYGAINIKNEAILTKEGVAIISTYQLPDGKIIEQEEYDRLRSEYSKMKIIPADVINFTPIDAYGQKGNPLDSLAKMADLASKFPDKIFFVAAGNPTLEDGHPNTPNILGAIEELTKQGKWPSNLFPIGYYGDEYDGKKYPSGYGPKYYISVDDLDSMDLPWGTSFATPVAGRAIMDYFSSKGIAPTPERVREVLDKFSEIHESYPVWDSATRKTFEKHDLKVVNLKKLTEDLAKTK